MTVTYVGVVRDSTSGEPLDSVSVFYEGEEAMALGHSNLTGPSGLYSLTFGYEWWCGGNLDVGRTGYDSKMIQLPQGDTRRRVRLDVALRRGVREYGDEGMSATITIAPGDTLIYQTWNAPEVVYTAGDRVPVEWRDGVTYIGGHVHKPQPETPPSLSSTAYLRSHYGNVPFMLSYVTEHAGNEEAIWNEAFLTWEAQRSALIHSVHEFYQGETGNGIPSATASQRAQGVLRASPLVSSVFPEPRSRPPLLFVNVTWAGESGPVLIDLGETPSRQGQWILERREFPAFVRNLRVLEGPQLVRVELRMGNYVQSNLEHGGGR